MSLNAPNIARALLRGRPCIYGELSRDIAGDLVVEVYVLPNPDSDLEDALLSYSSDEGTVTVTGDRTFFIDDDEFLPELLSAQGLYNLHVQLKNAGDDTVEFAEMFQLIASHELTDDILPVSAFLSTRFVNTKQFTSEADLDAIVTVGQDVGCIVRFVPPGEQPQEWILRASTDASEAGAKRRAGDYGASNQKVWVRAE